MKLIWKSARDTKHDQEHSCFIQMLHIYCFFYILKFKNKNCDFLGNYFLYKRNEGSYSLPQDEYLFQPVGHTKFCSNDPRKPKKSRERRACWSSAFSLVINYFSKFLFLHRLHPLVVVINYKLIFQKNVAKTS